MRQTTWWSKIKVVPVKCSQQERRGHAYVSKQLIGLALGVEVRHLVIAHESRHAVIVERHPPARILERGPDDVLEAGLFAA